MRPRSRRSFPPVATWLALVACFVVPSFIVAAEMALYFTGSAIDGPFQLYDALRRIAAGFRPGVDFQFFHGLGIPYIHYWLFRALGGRFQDAEMARELIAVAVFPTSMLLFFRAFARTWARAACLTAAAIGVVFALKMPALLFALNSMVGLRSTLPALIPIVLYRAERRGVRVVATGVMLGIALFVSTEQGLAATGAFLVVSTLLVVRRPDRRREVAEAAAALGIAAATLFVELTVVGGLRGARGALRYNFKLVPMDQYWFFGAPPNPFIGSWSDAIHMLSANPMIGLALLLGVGAVVVYARRLWRVRTGESGRLETALTFLAVYGLLSCASLLGAFIPVYTNVCWRVLISLAALEFLVWADLRESGRQVTADVPRAARIVALVIAAFVLVESRSFRSMIFNSVPRFVADHVMAHRGFEVAGIWPQTLTSADDLVRSHSGPNGARPRIWSTYAGWLEARNGIFQPSFDYIIHPLGPENRRLYLDTFRAMRPELVQTVRPAYTPYEPWIENANWDFYHELLRNYTIAGQTPWSFFWQRRADSAAAPQSLGGGTPPPGSAEVTLPAVPKDGGSPVTVLEVELEYDAKNPFRWLPIVGPMPRYLVVVEGAKTPMPISLDPWVSTSRFPVFARPGQTPVLHFQPFSLLPGAAISVRSIRVSVMPVDPRNAAWLQELARRYGF